MILVKSDAEFREGMVGTVYVPNPTGATIVGIESTGGFELIELRVSGELAWWPEYAQMRLPLQERKGVPLTRVMAHNRVAWVGGYIAVTVRCTKGPSVFVANVLVDDAEKPS